MLIIRRIVSECSSSVRHFHRSNQLVEQSSSVLHRCWRVAGCHNMALSGIESEPAQLKDSAQKSLEDEDEQMSAKRLKTSDNSLENAVGIPADVILLIITTICLLW